MNYVVEMTQEEIIGALFSLDVTVGRLMEMRANQSDESAANNPIGVCDAARHKIRKVFIDTNAQAPAIVQR